MQLATASGVKVSLLDAVRTGYLIHGGVLQVGTAQGVLVTGSDSDGWGIGAAG